MGRRNALSKKKISLALLGIALAAFWFCLPGRLFRSPVSYVLNDRKGDLMGASIAADGQWRFPDLDSVPYKFKKCIIAFEDKRFESHPGVDPLALCRAIGQDLAARRVKSGGSTLTMQVVRLATRRKRTLPNKLLEMLQALRLELTYRKTEILALYASHAPFGSNVVGLEAASWRYFGRASRDLSWGEMAALAILPNSPALVHPGRNRDELLRKRNGLLDKLLAAHVIDSTTAALARLEPIPDKPVPLPNKAPQLLGRIMADPSNSMGSRVNSTLDAGLQEQVSQVMERHHQVLKANGINNLAVLVLDVETGEALVYAGNIWHPENPDLQCNVDVIKAPRSPGSTLKPLLYAAMLNEGFLLPNSLVPDVPTLIGEYHPENFDLGYDGAVPASAAISRSLNIPAVKLLQKYKYERFYDFLQKLGVTTLKRPPDFYGLSLILGGGENSLWELAGCYASLARTLNHFPGQGGKYSATDYHPPFFTRKKPDDPQWTKNGRLDAGSIWWTFEAMEEVMRPGDEFLWQQFASSRRIAWKTGTSFGFRDGWAIGLDPRYVVGVWTGNTTGEGRAGLTGISAAAPVLFEVFNLLPAAGSWFEKPNSAMISTRVCVESGFRAGEYCKGAVSKPIPLAGLKSPVCPYHRLVHLDPGRQWQVNAGCMAAHEIVNTEWFVLPPAMEYYYKTKNYRYTVLPPLRPDCAADHFVNPLELIYPRDGATVYVPLEADGTRGKMVCNAAHSVQSERVFWHLDDRYMGVTRQFHQMALDPSPGRHRLTLSDAKGNTLSVNFTVAGK